MPYIKGDWGILNLRRNPSEIFIANTGNGQGSALFRNIEYNRYQPGYETVLGGAAGIIQGLTSLATAVINPNGTLVGGYYVGSRNADPSTITSPPNQIPVNPYGQQVESPVYGPSELGILYEGNQDNLNFGLAAKPLSDGGGIDGQFVLTHPVHIVEEILEFYPEYNTDTLITLSHLPSNIPSEAK